MKKLLVILALSTLFVSCRSGWSCKKRYVTNEKQIVIKNNYKQNS
jgi:hypothetical protein